MAIEEIEKYIGKKLPQVYKDLVLNIDDFEYIDGLSSIRSRSKVPWFFWGIERLEEVVVVGELQDAIGDDAVNIINSLKGEIAQTKTMNDDEIRELIVATAEKYDSVLDEQQIEEILTLVNKFNELNMDPDTFIKLMEAGQETQGFFQQVQAFFEEIGNFFSSFK